ncbi:MAG: transcriptional repressor [bacterium]
MLQTPSAVKQELLRLDLQRSGLRSTSARLAVLWLLRQTVRPLSHAEVVAALADQAWNRATLYRNLIDLVEAGLAVKTELGDRIWRFTSTTEHVANTHPHFVCTECGKLLCLPAMQISLDDPAAAPQTLRDNQVEIQIRGRCDDC